MTVKVATDNAYVSGVDEFRCSLTQDHLDLELNSFQVTSVSAQASDQSQVECKFEYTGELRRELDNHVNQLSKQMIKLEVYS